MYVCMYVHVCVCVCVCVHQCYLNITPGTYNPIATVTTPGVSVAATITRCGATNMTRGRGVPVRLLFSLADFYPRGTFFLWAVTHRTSVFHSSQQLTTNRVDCATPQAERSLFMWRIGTRPSSDWCA